MAFSFARTAVNSRLLNWELAGLECGVRLSDQAPPSQREKDWNHGGEISQRAQRECQFVVWLRERWHGSSLCLMPGSNQNPQLIRITLVIVPRQLHWNGLGK
jgi:hypothetical protein